MCIRDSSYAMNEIENNNLKIREIDNHCKIEFKTIHNTISNLESDSNLKLINVEQNIMNVKNELSMACLLYTSRCV